MKKFLFMLLFLLLLGCINTDEHPEFDIILVSYGWGSSGANFSELKLSYDIRIAYKGAKIDNDSLEIVMTDWMKERLISSEIVEIIDVANQLVVRGEIYYTSEGLSYAKISELNELEESIKGIVIGTLDGETFEVLSVDSKTLLR